MRMWHVDLLPYLPDMQFRGQLRELVAIMHDWRDKGKTNHILINHVTLFGTDQLYEYFRCYQDAWNARYARKLNIKYADEFCNFCEVRPERFRCYRLWHNDTYLRICMANLYEKYLGVGKTVITEKEWQTHIEG